jgi:hypothetical protein
MTSGRCLAHQQSGGLLMHTLRDRGLRRRGAVTLVTLPRVTDAATMRKISYWRYSAVNRKTLFPALACALLVFSMLGCGTSNHLQSIQLSTSNSAETPPGTLDLKGIGGTLQVYAWGNYSSGGKKLLNNVNVVYNIAITADNPFAVDPGTGGTYLLDAPPLTVELSTTGLLTAVSPSACTWFNSAAGTPAKVPAWSMVGSYSVTATYSGLTSPPVFVAVASAPGVFDANNNPTGACGP